MTIVLQLSFKTMIIDYKIMNELLTFLLQVNCDFLIIFIYRERDLHIFLLHSVSHILFLGLEGIFIFIHAIPKNVIPKDMRCIFFFQGNTPFFLQNIGLFFVLWSLSPSTGYGFNYRRIMELFKRK